jgi:hypothetical protein
LGRGQPLELLDLLDVGRETSAAMAVAAYSEHGAFYQAAVAAAAGLEGAAFFSASDAASLQAALTLFGGAAHRGGCASPGLGASCALAPAAELAAPVLAAGASEVEKAGTVQIFVRLSEGRTVAVDIEAPGASETGGWLRAQLEARVASGLRIALCEPGRAGQGVQRGSPEPAGPLRTHLDGASTA